MAKSDSKKNIGYHMLSHSQGCKINPFNFKSHTTPMQWGLPNCGERAIWRMRLEAMPQWTKYTTERKIELVHTTYIARAVGQFQIVFKNSLQWQLTVTAYSLQWQESPHPLKVKRMETTDETRLKRVDLGQRKSKTAIAPQPTNLNLCNRFLSYRLQLATPTAAWFCFSLRTGNQTSHINFKFEFKP